jgi:hypothetical protein
MKKKLIAGVIAVALTLSLSISAAAIGQGGSGAQGGRAGLNSAEKGAQLNARARVMSCLSVMAQNRAAVLGCKSENVQLGNQLRTMLQEMKANGSTLPEETLATLNELKAQMQLKRDELAATRGDIDALMTTYREYKQAGDLENAAAILDQVIAVQQTRITLTTQINAILQQMIDLLS